MSRPLVAMTAQNSRLTRNTVQRKRQQNASSHLTRQGFIRIKWRKCIQEKIKELRRTDTTQWSCSYRRALLQRMWKVSDERMTRSAPSSALSGFLSWVHCVSASVCVSVFAWVRVYVWWAAWTESSQCERPSRSARWAAPRPSAIWGPREQRALSWVLWWKCDPSNREGKTENWAEAKTGRDPARTRFGFIKLYSGLFI